MAKATRGQADRVYQALLGRIVQGSLAPGSRLIERDVAERLGVSRTPVRDAIRRLRSPERTRVTITTSSWRSSPSSRAASLPCQRTSVPESLNGCRREIENSVRLANGLLTTSPVSSKRTMPCTGHISRRPPGPDCWRSGRRSSLSSIDMPSIMERHWPLSSRKPRRSTRPSRLPSPPEKWMERAPQSCGTGRTRPLVFRTRSPLLENAAIGRSHSRPLPAQTSQISFRTRAKLPPRIPRMCSSV